MPDYVSCPRWAYGGPLAQLMFVRSLSTAAVKAAFASTRRVPSSPHALVRRTRCYATAVTVNGFSQLKPTPYGQPLAASHAHLIRKEETTPGIPQEEYDRRRRELMESLPDDSLVVCVAGQVKYMSGRES